MSITRPHFLLVDDHALFRTGLGLMLSQTWPGATVSEATTMAEAVALLSQGVSPDLILLDVHLPDAHGLADLSRISGTTAPGTPVLMMSADVNGQQILKAREAGVTGFVPKVASAPEVLEAVRTALRGDTAFAAVPYAVLADALPPRAKEAPLEVAEAGPSLSERQVAILSYLGRGTPNKAIARHMGMNEIDVRAEVSWLTEWLGASSREQAHAKAVARGLLAP